MGELFIEVLWRNRHIFLETKESEPGKELRLMLTGIFGEGEIKNATLVKTSSGKVNMEDQASNKWEAINEGISLSDNGITSVKARPNDPFVISLLFSDESVPTITSLSVPPPLPDSMRAQETPNMD
ncbi:elb-1 [Pristionchus pacificus]|uniref:Elb-1 n=1 Tax=Pristionchus pacificus TaxID=54126 RepID=A0A2A6CZ27_PRIPA|nr:elb-1 [Pristionchus pacificus]|eukprot:PDM83378.1 elb-1 [Pristionchus pacificus]